MRFVNTSLVRTRLDQRFVASDGVELSVDLYLPPRPGKYPVVLHRTPADNNRAGRAGISPPPAERWKVFAARGYIVATADVRGRGDADGRFVPFVNEAADGAATISWLRSLDECNGRIGLVGSGYGAFCAWSAAVADRNVDAIASISPFGAVGEGLVHRGGAVRLDWLFWMHLVGGRTVQPPGLPPWSRIFRSLPLQGLEDELGRQDIWWRAWLDHLDPADPFWDPLRLTEQISGLDIPGLHITGWWDGQVSAALSYYHAALRSGAPQCLVVGPWDTAAARRPVRVVGTYDFGPGSVVDVDEMVLAFFDDRLQSERTTNATAEAGARVFVTGCNEWVGLDSWPSRGADTLEFFLSSTSGANTRRGDGTLSTDSPRHAGADVIRHNPLVPVEFQPDSAGFATGRFTLDQAHITARDEALVYTSVALAESCAILGRPKITLTVVTEAADADIYVLLSDCFPLGARDLHLAHAAIRLATVRSFKPGEPLTLELELQPIAHEFQQGHHVRITVTPSLFPLYARNMQADNYAAARQATIADIELQFGAGRDAKLQLPLAAIAPSSFRERSAGRDAILGQ